MSGGRKRSLLERVSLARELLREYEAEEEREERFRDAGGWKSALERLSAYAASLPTDREESGAQRWAEAVKRHWLLNEPREL